MINRLARGLRGLEAARPQDGQEEPVSPEDLEEARQILAQHWPECMKGLRGMNKEGVRRWLFEGGPLPPHPRDLAGG